MTLQGAASFFVFVIFTLQISFSYGYMLGNNPNRRAETLDSRDHFHLEWEVHRSSKRVTFNVTVKTRGYVAFGLSQTGDLDGADVVIGGVLEGTRSSYFWDGHGDNHGGVLKDWRQNWRLHSGWQSDTHTFLSFSRDLETCDGDDFQITNDRVALIWGYGSKDEGVMPFVHHLQNVGTRNIYLLDIDYAPQIIRDPVTSTPKLLGSEEYRDWKLWNLPSTFEMPPRDTAYMCTLYKAPRLQRKHHVVGFNIHFKNDLLRRHVHHTVILKCSAPRGSPNSTRDLFEPHVGKTDECLIVTRASGDIPTQFCAEGFHGHAIGGEANFAPPEAGYPLGVEEDEYYLVQIHYDNPESRRGVFIDLNLEFWYTDKLRPNDADLTHLRHQIPGIPPSFLIPPGEREHTIFGHCGAGCTGSTLPPEGVTIFSVGLHSHNSGRKLQLHHFRGGVELPWIASDLNYAFDYQHTKTLAEPRVLLPGDQLTARCVYDSTWKANGTASVVGGFSTAQEMCVIYLHYYNKVPGLPVCSSEINSPEYRAQFLAGLGNVTFNPERIEFVAQDPPSLRGKTVTEIADGLVRWDSRRRRQLQRVHLYHRQINTCVTIDRQAPGGVRGFRGEVGYPFEVEAYQPESDCV